MVFTNLLSNALKYGPRGSAVAIDVASNGKGNNRDALHITVSDRGPGIPAVFRERVFDKFFRVEQQLQNGNVTTWGAGIGLYLCRQILEAHGGSISCEPGENGIGTRFVLNLPRENTPAN
jgi:NtrC-family two-component system sensor histidine kinase KinB